MTLRVLFALAFALSSHAAAAELPGRSEYRAPNATVAPMIDGVASESIWDQATWREIDEVWLGPELEASDFSGRFKVVWSDSAIYILVEVVDDVLYDAHRDPLTQYWDDDCLEVFIDEDHSGGEHQYNHNAFAYHVALDNQVVDIGVNQEPRLYNHHVRSHWRATGDKLVWELAIDIYDDSYVDDRNDNQPVELFAGKTLGLMLAWCDNDGAELRENFIGSETVPSGPTDRGWIDADLFGSVILAGEPSE
ncbi:MAG: CBM9 family sugar-binding protein [Woeseiaceae bacterium]